MDRVSRKRGLRAVLLFCSFVLAGTALAAAPVHADPAAPGGGERAAPARGDDADQGRAALATVERMFGLRGDGRAGRHAHATLALKDLAISKKSLTGADREAAEQLLSRPSLKDCRQLDYACYKGKSKRTCSSLICVHWVTKGQDRRNGVAGADKDDDGIPNYVEFVLKEMNKIHGAYVATGYRAPLGDGKRGGNSKPDIYLADLVTSEVSLYGYCTTDDPDLPLYEPTWAYCVLDNDYKRTEFPSNTPKQNAQVTAAHEYYHAVQFGYDIFEDNWFMEATATWAEDVLYDAVNDNVFYLDHGQMGHPDVPLDEFQNDGLAQYGNWIFFRYLSDRYGGEELLLQMWENADMTGGELTDQYSLQAVENALADAGIQLDDAFAQFAAANASPELFYDEAVENDYPAAPLQDVEWTLGPGAQYSSPANLALDHLASATYRFLPGSGATNLHVDVDVNSAEQGGVAVYTVKMVGQDPFTATVALDSNGVGSFDYSFSPANVEWITVTLANASDRFTCWQGTPYSCQGTPTDDNRSQSIVAQAS